MASRIYNVCSFTIHTKSYYKLIEPRTKALSLSLKMPLLYSFLVILWLRLRKNLIKCFVPFGWLWTRMNRINVVCWLWQTNETFSNHNSKLNIFQLNLSTTPKKALLYVAGRKGIWRCAIITETRPDTWAELLLTFEFESYYKCPL